MVANRTARSPELLAALHERAVHGPCEFTLLVPSTPHGLAWAADPHAGEDHAGEQREAFVSHLRGEGLDVADAKIGDADPLAAIQDECNFTTYDELIVSTLPLRMSKWLHLDLPTKAQAADQPSVTHIVASQPAAALAASCSSRVVSTASCTPSTNGCSVESDGASGDRRRRSSCCPGRLRLNGGTSTRSPRAIIVALARQIAWWRLRGRSAGRRPTASARRRASRRPGSWGRRPRRRRPARRW